MAAFFDVLERYYGELFDVAVGRAVERELRGLGAADYMAIEPVVLRSHPRQYKRLPGADVFAKAVRELPPPKVRPDLTRAALADPVTIDGARNEGQAIIAIASKWMTQGRRFTPQELQAEARRLIGERRRHEEHA